ILVALVGFDRELVPGLRDARDRAKGKLGAELRGVLLELLRHLRSSDHRHARVVVDVCGVPELPADGAALEHERLHARAAGVERRRDSCRASADDRDLVEVVAAVAHPFSMVVTVLAILYFV